MHDSPDLHNSPVRRHAIVTAVCREETEAQEDEVACPVAQSWPATEPGCKLRVWLQSLSSGHGHAVLLQRPAEACHLPQRCSHHNNCSDSKTTAISEVLLEGVGHDSLVGRRASPRACLGLEPDAFRVGVHDPRQISQPRSLSVRL